MVRVWELHRFGPATKVATRRSLAGEPHDYALRIAAKEVLRYPPVVFTGRQALAVAHGFQNAIARSGFRLYACCVLPDHVHAVVARHRIMHRQIMNQLKGEGSKALAAEGMHPFQNTFLPDGMRHTPWIEKGWGVFLDSPEAVRRAIAYVEQNPSKEGRPCQRWSFVEPYNPVW